MAHISSDSLSAEALSNNLSGSLPVCVSPEDVTKHPQLSLLLQDLTHRLSPSGTLKHTNTRLMHASVTLKHARTKYLEVTTLHRVSQDVLLDMCDTQDKKGKEMNNMLEALTLSELQDHLMLATDTFDGQRERHTDKESTLFGLTAEDMLASSKALHPEAYINSLSSAIEALLEREWVKICSFINSIGFEGCDSEDTTKIIEHLETTKQKVTEETNKLTHCVIQTHYLSQKVCGLLVEYSKILKSLVSKQRLSLFSTEILANCLITLKTYSLKLRCLELEILTDTYNKQSVQELRLLQGHLQKRRTQAEESLTKLRHVMEGYEQLDPKFLDLLKEYSKLQEDITFAKLSMGVGNL